MNAKSVYSNLGGGSHGHLGLVLADAQYALISNMPFVYLTFPGPLVILYDTTAHANSNMLIAHTKEVHLFGKLVGIEQALAKQIVAIV